MLLSKSTGSWLTRPILDLTNGTFSFSMSFFSRSYTLN